ncbi:tRNA (adenosine(37)-N6)-threonylcarbamoyltransferase complex ATPase subunit type 1 TsaE [Galbitalea soli]|uniref:tRNA threonylcarbamoyladenosine biosynthesis protein TsaE n=2 Tax=Galbitalea soli TaxID=1268042 RepID=A0A7C9TQ76_9MICO|nr:tRNA (adenosine(37)-N6)-threonylcarbamoyltransferase complex ATPase subunit type 1 TsaE [Galbitalea soli]NEM91256.1 tRNA (adenosine(37)-N6)-threonylcarbamoyltransferase complex ATPase subunit type 1 TsaE [Galbitalea soli]
MEAFGARVAQQLRAGDVVALNGPLGAGKTTLTRGLGAALGVRGTVTSPTFVLARTHPRGGGLPPLVHVDAYRLRDPLELDDLDIDFARSIVVVEWAAGMLDQLVDEWLQIDIRRPQGAAEESRADVDAVERVDVIEPDHASDALDAGDAVDAIEPRVAVVHGHGARWSELGWVDAARD